MIKDSFSSQLLSKLCVVTSRGCVKRHDFPAAFRPAFTRESEQAGRTALNKLLAEVANDVAGRAYRGVLGRSSCGGKRRRIIHGTTGAQKEGDENLFIGSGACQR
jgi:hypothetical protein